MGAYNPDEMNGPHWQWHQLAALRMRATMQEHNIWDIPRSPGYQGHASCQRLPRSQDVPEPPRQAARRNSPERPRGPPSRMAEWVPPLACTEAPYDRSPRGGAQAVLTPRGCKAARRSGARRRRTLAAPAAAVAHHLPRHGEPSSMRVWTGTMGAPTTPTPNGHHLPLIPDADPRGPAPNGRTYPPISRQSSASDRQRFTRAPAGLQTEHPAHPPPPTKGRRPTRCRGGPHATDRRPKEPAADPRPAQGVRGAAPPKLPPPRARGDDTAPGRGHRLPDRPDLCTTGFPTPAAAQPNHQGAEGASQQRGHDTSGPDAEMTAARRHDLLDGPTTGAPHGVSAWGTPWHDLTAPLPD